MRIGLTYDLREDYLKEGYGELETAEFDRPDTIIAIESTLQELGFATDRIGNIKALLARLTTGDRWDLVFNIAEGMYGIGREAQVPAVLDAYRIPYTFADTVVLAVALDKGITKHIVQSFGIPTPNFHVVAAEEDIADVNIHFPLFAKPVAEGTGKGVDGASKICNHNDLKRVCRRLLDEFRQPVLVEQFLPGREFTVGILGTGKAARALGTIEVALRAGAEQHCYSYVNKERCEELVDYLLEQGPLAKACEEVALRSWRALNCRDAGRVDIRCDSSGQPHFLEVNPLAGLNPHHSDLPILCTLLGRDYRFLIKSIVDSALKRIASYNTAKGGVSEKETAPYNLMGAL
jgi:D-alanine-D-alanine ligase